MTLVFYDGVCGLCNRLVRFLLARDRHGVFRFAPLQGELARRELTPRGLDPRDVDTLIVIADWHTPHARTLERSRAVLFALEQVGGVWATLGRLARAVPTPIADAVYGIVARHRYRVFGQFEACPMPKPEWRDKFVDTGNGEP